MDSLDSVLHSNNYTDGGSNEQSQSYAHRERAGHTCYRHSVHSYWRHHVHANAASEAAKP